MADAFDDAWVGKDRHGYTLFDNAWSLMKAWQFEGVRGDSSDDIMPLIGDVMAEYDAWRENPYGKKNPEGARKPELRVPSRGISGGNRKKPLKQMMLEGGGGANTLQQRVPGLRDRSLGGLPQILNWWGGKQQLGPYFRQMFKPYRETHTPYEAFGGSLSMLNALNSPRGIATDINPDPINVGRMAQIGLNIPSFGPLDSRGVPVNTKEALQDIVDRANDLRFRRDMLGEDLSLNEQMKLAQLFASANSRAFQGHMNYQNTPEWDKGFGIMKPGLRKVTGGRGEPSIPMDFRAMAPLMRDWDLRTDRMQDVSREMNERDDIFSYYDPPYARRTFSYGDKSTADEEDQLQHDTLHAAINSPGPVAYSNYMIDPDTREVLHGITDPLVDEGFDIHPWPRNIKTSKGGGKNVVEMIATRDIDWPGMGRKNRWDRFSWRSFLDENPSLKDFMGDN